MSTKIDIEINGKEYRTQKKIPCTYGTLIND